MTEKNSLEKYRAFKPIDLPDRKWPNRQIEAAPLWCSVDLRDGNQALVEPMNADRKQRMFNLLVEMGIKEIEVGFPAASQTDFDFVRKLINGNLIPADVTIQVLTQARPELIDRTMEALKGVRRAIVHVYNSTSTLQRRVVFGMDRQGVKNIAVDAVRSIRSMADDAGDTEIVLEYSPESFTGTELDYAKDVCEAVMDAWGAAEDRKIILNLPATVEMSTPNIYADQIEWMLRNLKNRNHYILSVHPHNDRGTGVAAAELALMAGCDRVEGTLFGNGERTGNVDIVNIALNLFTQGVDPKMSIDDIDEVAKTVEYCNQLPIHPRHPYVGDLVYTAFSGSHQDAIKKGFEAMEQNDSTLWEIPYLPIDPQDVGRSYEAIVRVNSQSGKGGVAYLLKADYGLDLPRPLQIEFSKTIQEIADKSGEELSSEFIWRTFSQIYMPESSELRLKQYETKISKQGENATELKLQLSIGGVSHDLLGVGAGPIDASLNALAEYFDIEMNVSDYREHAIGKGSDAEAAAYVSLTAMGETIFGVGVDSDVTSASIKAILNAVFRLQKLQHSH